MTGRVDSVWRVGLDRGVKLDLGVNSAREVGSYGRIESTGGVGLDGGI